MRRAMPSSSISAAAARNWSTVATNTDLPCRPSVGPSRIDPSISSSQVAIASRPTRMRDDRLPAAMIEDLRHAGLACCIFIEPDEVAEGHGKACVLVVAERVFPKRAFQARHNNREAERIQARIEQGKVVGERRELFVMLQRNLFELR